MHKRTHRALMLLSMLVAVATVASAAQVQSTTTRGLNAVMQASGFHIQPAGLGPMSGGDLAAPQMFELVRPGNQAVTIGRIFTSCVCVSLEADKRSFAPGEPVVLRLRNVRPTPPQGQTYAIFVQITSPIRTTLRFDTFVQSAQFVPAPAGMPPTRGNIISDGIYTGRADDTHIEVIVPRSTVSAVPAEPVQTENTVQDAALSSVLVTDDIAERASAAVTRARAAEARAAEAAKTAEIAAGAAVAAATPTPVPVADPELRSVIESAVATAERNLSPASLAAAGRTELRQMAVQEVTERAQEEALAATRLATVAEAPRSVQAEVQQLGEEILERDQAAAAIPAPAPSDDIFAPVRPAKEKEAMDELQAASLRAEAARLGREIKAKAVVAKDAIADTAGDAGRAISEKAAVAADKAGEAGEKAAESASSTWQELRIKSRALREELGESARSAGRYIDDKTQPARDTVAEKARDAGRYIDDKTQPARDVVSEKARDAANAVKDAVGK
ncbi:MAG: hypothetical protein LUC93_10175 [Planctomycetaceae bacterium]|nr:hypothetical protein [Planctomycetaceae bacterium]